MLRISTNTNKIVSIKWFTKETLESSYDGNGGGVLHTIDSFIIIPGVTQYQHIYSVNNLLCFDSQSSYIGVEFLSSSDLERFFVQLMRDIKVNQITNVNVSTDSKIK